MTQKPIADKIPRMADTIHDRIKERMKIMGLNPSATSLKAGLSREAVRKMLINDGQMPSGKALSGLANALEVSEQWLLTGDQAASTPRPEVRSASKDMPLPFEMANDVPVMGTAAGSHIGGAFQLSTDPVDYVRRPPTLIKARNVYSLFVEGTSMEPQYAPGDLIYVHPDKPARIGDVVVVQCQLTSEGHVEATLGIYSKSMAEKIIIRKHNPPAEVEISKEIVIAIHKVLSMNEIYGV